MLKLIRFAYDQTSFFIVTFQLINVFYRSVLAIDYENIMEI